MWLYYKLYVKLNDMILENEKNILNNVTIV